MSLKSLRRYFLYDILRGLILTFSYMFKRRVTINYPYEKGPMFATL